MLFGRYFAIRSALCAARERRQLHNIHSLLPMPVAGLINTDVCYIETELYRKFLVISIVKCIYIIITRHQPVDCNPLIAQQHFTMSWSVVSQRRLLANGPATAESSRPPVRPVSMTCSPSSQLWLSPPSVRTTIRHTRICRPIHAQQNLISAAWSCLLFIFVLVLINRGIFRRVLWIKFTLWSPPWCWEDDSDNKSSQFEIRRNEE